MFFKKFLTKKTLHILLIIPLILSFVVPIVSYGQTPTPQQQEEERTLVDMFRNSSLSVAEFFARGGVRGAIGSGVRGAIGVTRAPEAVAGFLGNQILGEAVDWLETIVKYLSAAILSISALLLGFAGVAFTFILEITVFDLKNTLGAFNGFLENGWTFFRDLASIIFIFLILIAAIKIIIGGNLYGQKKVLSKIIVVALVMNFSLFFTKLVIDVSNIATVGIYNAFVEDSLGGNNINISDAIMGHLRVVTLYDYKNEQDTKAVAAKLFHDGSIPQWIALAFFGSIIMWITSFVLLSAAIMFVTRFVVFLIAMLTSPLAFIATILPSGSSWFNKWLQMLTRSALYAPVFFMLLYITFLFASNSYDAFGGRGVGQFDVAGNGATTPGATNDASLAKLLTGTGRPGPDSLALVLNYITVIGFLLITIFASNKISASGAGGVKSFTDFGTRAAGGLVFGGAARLGRNSIGRAGNSLANSRMVKNLEASNAFGRAMGSTLKNVGDKTAKASFDGRNAKGIAQLLKGTDLGKNEVGNKGYANVLKDITEKTAAREKNLSSLTTTEIEAKRVAAADKDITGARKAFTDAQNQKTSVESELRRLQREKRNGSTEALNEQGNSVPIDTLIAKQASLLSGANKKENDSLKSLNDAYDKHGKYTKIIQENNRDFLDAQAKIAKAGDQRSMKFMQRLSEGGFTQKIVDGILYDKDGTRKTDTGTAIKAKAAHWAIKTISLPISVFKTPGASDAKKEFFDKKIKETSTKTKQEQDVGKLIKTLNPPDENSPTTPPAPPAVPPPAAPAAGGGTP